MLGIGDFDSGILREVAHRPWRIPDAPWVMTQTWNDLLFAHWPVDSRKLRPLVPPAFELDLQAGDAWIGVVPFRMTNVGPRGIPWLPWVSSFPELNVRTYVRVGDRPGVFFFSLDAGSSLAVQAARSLLNLPYYSASMRVAYQGSTIEYESRRARAGDPAAFHATYKPAGPAFTAKPGSLEYFLTERYCLYHIDRRGMPYRLEIHHPPWLLQPADGDFIRNSMAAANGLSLPYRSPLLHFAKRQDMVAWAPRTLRV